MSNFNIMRQLGKMHKQLLLSLLCSSQETPDALFIEFLNLKASWRSSSEVATYQTVLVSLGDQHVRFMVSQILSRKDLKVT